MASNFFRTTAAAAVVALTVGATIPSALAESSTLGETGYLDYGVTNGSATGDATKNTNKAERYLQGSGISSGSSDPQRNTAQADTNTPRKAAGQSRYMRGSGISSGPVGIGK